MKRFCLILAFLAFSACSDKPAVPADNAESVSASTEQSTTVTSIVPALTGHNYTANEDGIYLYAETLSKAQRDAGVGAAGFVAFKYLGLKDGLHYLQDENSMVIATCANPCTIIRRTLNGQVVNRIQFNPQTIIGAAFVDAINGKLNLYTQYKQPASNEADDALLAEYADLNGQCRGGSGDDPKTMKACDQRDALAGKLEKAGYCYGEFAEYGFQSAWAKCSATKEPKPEF